MNAQLFVALMYESGIFPSFRSIVNPAGGPGLHVDDGNDEFPFLLYSEDGLPLIAENSHA